MDKNHLLILETVKDARYYLNNRSTMPIFLHDLDIISTQPDIQAYLLKNNIKCKNSSVYVRPEDYSIINNKMEMIETYISDCIRKISGEIPPPWVTNSFTYYFRYSCYYLFWDMRLISNILNDKHYKSVVAFQSNGNSRPSPWVLPEERYLGEILERVTKQRAIKFLGIPVNDRNKKDKVDPSALRKFFNWACFNIFRLGAKKFANEKSVLIPSSGKNMDLLCCNLLNDNDNLKFCKLSTGSSFFAEFKDVLQILLYYLFNLKMVDQVKNPKFDFQFPLYTIALYHYQDYTEETILIYVNMILSQLEIESKNLTVFETIDLIDLIVWKVKNHILPYLLQQDLLSFGIKKGLQFMQPDFVISQMSLSINCALGYLSEEMDIPSVLISHGSHVKHEDKYSAREHEILANNILVGGYRYLGVQSPIAKKMAEKTKSESEMIINIHPVIWGRNIKTSKPHPDKLTIVHAGTFKSAARRFMYETADEMLDGLSDLSAIIANNENLEMIIKFRADLEFSTNSLNSLLSPLPTNVIIDNKSPFIDVLGQADLLISFSSTTIEEALVNGIPVLLYGGGGRYAHIPVHPYQNGNPVEKAVTFIQQKDQLANYFAALNQKYSSFTVPSDEFNSYRFKDEDAVEFSDWFANIMKPGVAA